MKFKYIGYLIKITDTLTLKSTGYSNSKYNQWNLDNYRFNPKEL